MSPSSPPSIDEQIRVLQAREDVATRSLQHLGLPPEWRDTLDRERRERCQQAVDRVFTLTRRDIEGWLEAKGLAAEELTQTFTEAGSRDGFYLVREGNRWHYYYQERGGAMAGATFAELAEARKLLLNEWLPVWLSHLRVPCRTADGRVIERL